MLVLRTVCAKVQVRIIQLGPTTWYVLQLQELFFRRSPRCSSRHLEPLGPTRERGPSRFLPVRVEAAAWRSLTR